MTRRVVFDTSVLVSSDYDLLTLHPWGGVAIVTPIEFLVRLTDEVRD